MPAVTPGGLERRIAEARQQDVGRGIVRLQRADLQALGVQVGGLLGLRGARMTVVKALPALPDQGPADRVHVDGLVRRNCGAGVGDPVTIRPVQGSPARSIRLASRTPVLQGRDQPFLARQLDGLPVVAGDVVQIPLFGGRAAEMTIEATTPEGPVLVHADTRFEVSGAASPERRHHPTWEDVGGLGRQIHRIREMIELPLRHPELFERLGVDPPKGVLLHGPPGCGKTLIARIIAHESAARFFVVSGPEIIHKNYGESEAQLRRIFAEATKQGPSIVFLDEIDSLAPARDRVVGDVEKRVVATLLTLMDGLAPRNSVVVIAATNLPNALDPALRRPGRFDREITIPVPDRVGRREILEIHARGMPLAPDVDLDAIAGMTHGYVGADLAALCREAAMARLRAALPPGDLRTGELPPEGLIGVEIALEDFVRAHAEIEPSAIREVFVEVPRVRWSDLGGLGHARALLEQAVQWPLTHAALFEAARLQPPRGVMLHGPPGTGKTLLAKALATESQLNFLLVKGPELLSRWVGDSERAVRELFRKARAAAPCVLFFDEIDGLAPARGADASGASERVLTQLLTELDSVEPLEGVLVLGATNRLDRLDPALLRPGRFDEIVEIGTPDAAGLREILDVHLRGRPVGDLDRDRLVAQLEGASGSDVANVVRQAALGAVQRAVSAGGGPEAVRIGQADVEAAIDTWLTRRSA